MVIQNKLMIGSTVSDSRYTLSRASELSVQQLQTFQLVYQHRGYAAAARELDLSVPTVWQQIQSIQRLYGFPLFEKQGRGIVPTPKATKLYEQLSELLAGLDSTFELADQAHDQAVPITLVAGVRMMMEEIAEPLFHFHQQWDHPLVVRQGNDRVAEQMVLAGEADLAFALEPGHDKISKMVHVEPAYCVEFMAIYQKSHPLAGVKKMTLRELVKHELVVTTPGTHGRDALDHALHRERLQAQFAAETDNSGFTIACVRAGLGVGILAGRPAGELCRQLEVRSLRRQLGRRQIVFMWKKGRRLTPALESLVDTVRKRHAGGM